MTMPLVMVMIAQNMEKSNSGVGIGSEDGHTELLLKNTKCASGVMD